MSGERAIIALRFVKHVLYIIQFKRNMVSNIYV